MRTFHFEFRSLLTMADCLQRLRENIDHQEPRDYTLRKVLHGDHEIIGFVDGDKAELRRRIAYSSLFQPVASAQLRSTASQTIITTDVQINSFGRRFMWLWAMAVTFVSLVMLLGVALSWSRGTASAQTWLGVFVPPFLLIGVAALQAVSRRMLRVDAEFLESFLRKTLDATPHS